MNSLLQTVYVHLNEWSSFPRPLLRENVEKRYLLHVAGFNLGLLMRKMTGYGTPKGAADAWNLIFVGYRSNSGRMLLVFAVHDQHPDNFIPVAAVSNPSV